MKQSNNSSHRTSKMNFKKVGVIHGGVKKETFRNGSDEKIKTLCAATASSLQVAITLA